MALALLVFACLQNDKVASTEILNPPGKSTVVGLFSDENGKPIFGTVVRAYPIDYNPVSDTRKDEVLKHFDSTDAEGKFEIEGLDSGTYNIVAEAGLSGKKGMIRTIHVDGENDLTLGRHLLKRTGALTYLVPDSLTKKSAFIWIPGTPFKAALERANRESHRGQLDSLPPGHMPAVVYSNLTSAYTLHTLVKEVPIRSDDTLPADVNSSFRYNKRIFLNTTLSGANLMNHVTNFPLRVRIGAGDIDFSLLQKSGNDIRFTKPDGSPLAYELEVWDPANSQAAAWVRMDNVSGNTSSQYIRMYFGDSTAVSKSSGPAVFSPQIGYRGVWHLNEVSGDVPGQYQDATGNGNHGTGIGMTRFPRIPSLTGYSQEFDSVSTAINTGASPTLHSDNALTLESWIQIKSFRARGNFIAKGYDGGGSPFYEYGLTLGNLSNNLRFTLTINGINYELGSIQTFNLGEWTYVAGTFDGNVLRIFINGVEVRSWAISGTVNDFGRPLILGNYEFPSGTHFDGFLDEPRVSVVARDAAYFKLTFENLKPDSRLLRIEVD
jgi:hypothetical protein